MVWPRSSVIENSPLPPPIESQGRPAGKPWREIRRGLTYQDGRSKRSVLSVYSESSSLMLVLGTNPYPERGEFGQAIKDLDEAIRLDPKYGDCTSAAAPQSLKKENTTVPLPTSTSRSEWILEIGSLTGIERLPTPKKVNSIAASSTLTN
jgi:hypothetical protein